MDAIKPGLAQLLAAPVQRLKVAAVRTDEQYQPRVMKLVPHRKQTGITTRTDEHIGTMKLALEASEHTELDPVLVALVEGEPFIVDGHHRLAAYKRAGRETIPARACLMSRMAAVMASKVANCTSRALEMHPEQRRDAGWHYLAEATHRGSTGLPAGESLRTVAALFGIGKNTVASMLHSLPRVDLTQYSPEACDPGTHFPRWCYVKAFQSGWRGYTEDFTMDKRLELQADRLAEKIGNLLEQADPRVQQRAIAKLRRDRKLEQAGAEGAAFLKETTSDLKAELRGAGIAPEDAF